MVTHSKRVRALVVLTWTLLSTALAAAGLWPEEEQRLQVGLKLFPAVLGALEQLSEQYASDGKLRVLVVYQDPGPHVRQAVSTLQQHDSIQGLALEVDAVALTATGLEDMAPAPAAIFIASSGIDAARLRQLAQRHRRLVFSPFAGDVAKGAVAGIYITDRILPSVNLTQAERTGLRFKAFFLRVAHREN